MSFTARRDARTDYSDSVFTAIRVSYEQNALPRRTANGDKPTLIRRVVGIVKRLSQWI
jgi:hypothetical protein